MMYIQFGLNTTFIFYCNGYKKKKCKNNSTPKRKTKQFQHQNENNNIIVHQTKSSLNIHQIMNS